MSERLWKYSNHTWNPNICTKDTAPPEEATTQPHCGGSTFPFPSLAHLFGPFYSKQMALFCVFLRASARWQFSWIPRSSLNICKLTVNQCHGLCKLHRFRNIKNDSWEEYSHGNSWTTGPIQWAEPLVLWVIVSTVAKRQLVWHCRCRQGLVLPVTAQTWTSRRRVWEGAENAGLSSDKCILWLFI